MAGQFFEKESQIRPDTCRCEIARDESDHTDPDKHWQTSQFVKQCDAHKASGATAAEVHQENMSKNVVVNTLRDNLSDDAYMPVIDPTAVPSKVTDPDGNVIGWQYDKAAVMDKTLIAPVEYLIAPALGKIAVRHPNLDDALHATLGQALTDDPHANLELVDLDTCTKVFAALDAALAPPDQLATVDTAVKSDTQAEPAQLDTIEPEITPAINPSLPLFWNLGADGNVVISHT